MDMSKAIDVFNSIDKVYILAILIFLGFIILMFILKRAKCPACHSTKCKEKSRRVLRSSKKTRTTTVKGVRKKETYYVGEMEITYVCKKCQHEFTRKEKKTSNRPF